MTKSAPSIRSKFLKNMVFLALVSLGLWSAIWIQGEYSAFRNEADSLKAKMIDEQKSIIRDQTTQAVDYIDYMRNQTEIRLKNTIESRVKEAHSIAMHIYNEYKNTKAPEEIQHLIKEALRPVRFSFGRGYYFAFTMEGIEVLHADRPEMEGMDMLGVRGSNGEYVVRDMIDLVKVQGEGFYQYTWTKPKREGRIYPKIAYVKRFKPYDWVFGAGEYLDDVEMAIQDEVLNRLVNIRYGNDGYLFGSTFEGESLFTNGQITKGSGNISDLTDPNGVKIVQEQQRIVKNQGDGFVLYSWRKLEGEKPIPKIVYVAGVPKWGWIIGTGVYLDTIDALIREREAGLWAGLKSRIIKTFLLFIALIAIIFFWAKYISDQLSSGIEAFTTFFQKAVTGSASMEDTRLQFEEFQTIASTANRILEDKKTAEEASAQSRVRYLQIFEHMGSGLAIYSTIGEADDFVFADINPTGARIGRRPREDHIGHSVREVYPGVVELGLFEAFQRVWQTGNPERIPLRQYKDDKISLYVENYVAKLPSGEIIAVYEDRTERKKAEDALQESEKRMRAIVDAMPALLDAFDENGRIVYWNRECERVTGYSAEEVIDNPKAMELLYPDSEYRARVFATMQNYGGDFLNLEFDLTCKDGSQRAISWSNISDKIPISGWATWALGVDITDRKQVEKELRESEERLQGILDAVGAGVFIIDPDTFVITYANPAASELLELPKNQIVGSKCKDTVCPTINGSCPALESGDDIHSTESEIIAVDGRKIPVLKTVSSTILGGRQVLLESFIDLSALRKVEAEKTKIEDQLRQAQKMEAIGTLAGGIAHDFNNILGAIIGYSELSLLDLDESDSTYKNVHQAYRAATRAKELVKQILTFSRQTERLFTPVNVVPIVREALKFLRSTLPVTIEIQQDIPEKQYTVMADSTQIHQVMMNLCTNAAHAMREEGGIISIKLSEYETEEESDGIWPRPGRYLNITVSDTGHGMDRATLGRIFEPYFTTKKQGEGTGMGLAMVHGIIKSHQGEIKVYSEPGQGTTFQLYLPLHAEKSDKDAKTVKNLPTGTEYIMYVDDEPALVEIGGRMLQRLGYRVDAVTDSLEALKRFRSNREQYDLLITDQTMPKMTGADLAREVLQIRPDLPVILCTGFSETLSMAKIDEIGAYALLMKPLALEKLAATVRSALDLDKNPVV